MITSLIPILASIISGAVSSSSHQKTIQDIKAEQEKLKVPDAVLEGEAILRDMSMIGMPGYESAKEEITSQLPTTLNQLRDYAGSGQMIDIVSKLYAQQNQALRGLSREDEAQKVENRRTFANYLGGTKASYESNVATDRLNLELMKMGEKQAKTVDSLNFANQAAGSLDPTKDILKMLQGGDYSSLIASLFGRDKKQEETTTYQFPYGDQPYGTGNSWQWKP